MVTLILAAIYLGCGAVYLTPGALPVSALAQIKWSRHIVGACLFVAAATYRPCGHWVWGTVLVAALLFSTVAA